MGTAGALAGAMKAGQRQGLGQRELEHAPCVAEWEAELPEHFGGDDPVEPHPAMQEYQYRSKRQVGLRLAAVALELPAQPRVDFIVVGHRNGAVRHSCRNGPRKALANFCLLSAVTLSCSTFQPGADAPNSMANTARWLSDQQRNSRHAAANRSAGSASPGAPDPLPAASMSQARAARMSAAT